MLMEVAFIIASSLFDIINFSFPFDQTFSFDFFRLKTSFAKKICNVQNSLELNFWHFKNFFFYFFWLF